MEAKCPYCCGPTDTNAIICMHCGQEVRLVFKLTRLNQILKAQLGAKTGQVQHKRREAPVVSFSFGWVMVAYWLISTLLSVWMLNWKLTEGVYIALILLTTIFSWAGVKFSEEASAWVVTTVALVTPPLILLLLTYFASSYITEDNFLKVLKNLLSKSIVLAVITFLISAIFMRVLRGSSINEIVSMRSLKNWLVNSSGMADKAYKIATTLFAFLNLILSLVLFFVS